MIKEAFGKGATNEEAIEAAKNELNAPWDADVQVELIKMAKKNTLGLFGGSLAEARAYIEIPDEIKQAPKKQVKEAKAKPQQKAGKKPEEKKPEPKKVEEAVEAPAASEKEMFVGEASKKAEKYIRSILEGMGVGDISISVSEDDEGVVAQLDCGNDYG